MASVCKDIAREFIVTETKIKIENLYKIFGSRPQSVLAEVQRGMTKGELLEKHNHVLGLKDINIDVSAREISVIMGLSGSGKVHLDTPHQSVDRTHLRPHRGQWPGCPGHDQGGID